MTEPVIELAGVEKAFRFFRLSDVHLRLEAGQIMGFVGPNGAGKSTTIRMLMGMLRQDRGEIRVLGRSMPGDQAAAKRDIGFVSEDMGLYGGATLAWHMRFVASVRPHWDPAYAAVLLRRFNLHAEQAIKALSHGERVKAMLLLALAHRPRLLLLDEPTTGLDPVARHEVLAELMDAVQDERRAILFSSHNTHDVEQVSDAITFLDRGRVIDSKDKETFLDCWRRLHLELPASGAAPVVPGAVDSTVSGRTAVITTRTYSPEVHGACERAGAGIRDVQRMTLEEIFAYVGGVSLICTLVILNITVVMSAVVQERKDKVLLFVLSLPVSAARHTLAKVLATAIAFVVPWLVLTAGAVIVVDASALPNGTLPFLLTVLVYLLAYHCVLLGVALVSDSMGWPATVITVGNISVNFLIPYLLGQTSIYAHRDGPTAIWTADIVAFIGIELAAGLVALLVAVTWHMRRQDAI